MAYERRPVRNMCRTPGRMWDSNVRDRSLFSRVLRMCLRRLGTSFLLIGPGVAKVEILAKWFYTSNCQGL